MVLRDVHHFGDRQRGHEDFAARRELQRTQKQIEPGSNRERRKHRITRSKHAFDLGFFGANAPAENAMKRSASKIPPPDIQLFPGIHSEPR